MAELDKEQSLAERDPAQIRWAVRDLYDINDLRWNGGNAVIPPETFARYRDAAKIVMHAYSTSGFEPIPDSELIDNQPIFDEDEEAGEDIELVSRKERFKQDTAFAKAYDILREIIEGTVDDLCPFDWLGEGEDPFGAMQDKLQAALNETESISAPFLDRLLLETEHLPPEQPAPGYPIIINPPFSREGDVDTW